MAKKNVTVKPAFSLTQFLVLALFLAVLGTAAAFLIHAATPGPIWSVTLDDNHHYGYEKGNIYYGNNKEVVTPDGSKLIVMTNLGAGGNGSLGVYSLRAYEPATGKELWRTDATGANAGPGSEMKIANGRVIVNGRGGSASVCSGNGNLATEAYDCHIAVVWSFDINTGKLMTEVPLPSPVASLTFPVYEPNSSPPKQTGTRTVSFYGEDYYLSQDGTRIIGFRGFSDSQNYLESYNPLTGARAWHTDIPQGHSTYASLNYVGKDIFLLDTHERFSGSTGQKIADFNWHTQIGTSSDGLPLYRGCGTMMVSPDENTVICISQTQDYKGNGTNGGAPNFGLIGLDGSGNHLWDRSFDSIVNYKTFAFAPNSLRLYLSGSLYDYSSGQAKPGGSKLYAIDSNSGNSVWVKNYSTSSNANLSGCAPPNPLSLIVSPDGDSLYATLNSSLCTASLADSTGYSVIRLATTNGADLWRNVAPAGFPASNSDLAVAPDGSRVFATDGGGSRYDIIAYTKDGLIPGSGTIVTVGTGATNGATTSQASDTTAPSTPTTLHAAVATNSPVVALSWAAASDNSGSLHYQVERATDVSLLGPNWISLNDKVADPTYNDTTASFNTKYSYRVRAIDGAGNTSGYASVDVTTVQFLPNVSLSNSTTIASSDGQATVSIPAGAVSQQAPLCEVLSTKVDDKRVVAAYSLVCRQADGTTTPPFAASSNLTITLSKSTISGYTNFGAREVDANGAIVSIPASTYDVAAGTLSVPLDHPATIAVVADARPNYVAIVAALVILVFFGWIIVWILRKIASLRS